MSRPAHRVNPSSRDRQWAPRLRRATDRPATSADLCQLVGFVRAASWPSIQRRLSDVPGGTSVGALGYGFLAALHRPAASMGLVDDEGVMIRDPQVLGPLAVEHERLLKVIQDRGPVLPSGLGSLFSGDGDLEALMEAHQGSITSFLERVEGCREWQVRIVDTAPPPAAISGEPPDGAELPTGGAHLASRRRALRSHPDGDDRRALAADCLRPLDLPSWDWRALALPANGSSRLLLRSAALVPDGALDAFLACAEARRPTLVAHRLDLQVIGPFPPYSFTPDLGLGLGPGRGRGS